MTLKVTSSLVNSVQGVPISVTGIAQVRNTATVGDIQCGHSSLCRRLLNVHVNKLTTTKRHLRILVVAMTTAKFVQIPDQVYQFRNLCLLESGDCPQWASAAANVADGEGPTERRFRPCWLNKAEVPLLLPAAVRLQVRV